MGILRKILKVVTKPIVNDIKGSVGEAKVNRRINSINSKTQYHRLVSNLMIEDEKGKTHQIDQIDIRTNGIFCIETKNYQGIILGSEHSEKWTQVIYNEKNTFFNPLKQNKAHVYHISNILDFKYKVHSLIVLVKNNADKIGVSNVINLKDLRYYIHNYNDGTNLSNEEIDKIYDTLINAKSLKTKREHVQKINENKQKIKCRICPQCGGNLIERTGKYGNFLGCSNYPDCKAIYKL